MKEREPYLVLRNFHVWFQKRRGFVESLLRAAPAYVRAVDGIDITIGRGEIYCLVGESGCGKTTTGKGILRLVEPTDGDVFLTPTEEELSKYEAAKAAGDRQAVQEFRRRRSLTYAEKVSRKPVDYLRHLALIVAGAALGVLLTFGLVLGIRALGAASVESLAYVALGILVAFAGTLPWARMSRRVPHVLSLATIPPTVVAQILAVGAAQAAAHAPNDLGSTFDAYVRFLQNPTLFVALFQVALAALAAWYASAYFIRLWVRRRGEEVDRLHKLRTKLQIIYQDPYESLNPRHTVYDIVAEPLLVNRVTRGTKETQARVERALEDAGLRPPKEYILRYPHEMSGGQRQRVSLAASIVLEPDFVVADEPVSMLDVSIRTEIIELLLQLRQKRGLTYLFITHDLSLAWVLADRIGVMYLGKIVEEGPTENLITNPLHPYTKALISVVPIPDPDKKHDRMILRGERPDPANIPRGCRFHPRCPAAFERCGWTSDEVLDALKEVAVEERASELATASVAGPDAIVWSRASVDFVTWLQGVVSEKSAQVRALTAIQTIERKGAGAKAVLHPYQEPDLRELTPGIRVACHLYS